MTSGGLRVLAEVGVSIVVAFGLAGCDECSCDQACTRTYWLGSDASVVPGIRLTMENRSETGTDCTMEQVTPSLPSGRITVIGTVRRPAPGQPYTLTLLGYFAGDVRVERCGTTPSFDSAAAVLSATLVDGDEVCVADELRWEWSCVRQSCAI